MSGMLDRLRARHEAELKVTRRVVRQEMADMAVLALHRAFGFGPDRCKRFITELNQVAQEVGELVDGDTKDGMFAIARFEACLQ
jgi:hypothetical protein